MEFKDRLQEALKARGMTKAELARRSGLDKGAITKYTKGENLPGSDAVMKMAKALTVRPGWLLGGDGDMDELVFVELFESLDDTQKERLLKYMKALKDGIV